MRIDFPYVREKSSLFGRILRPMAKVVIGVSYPQWMYVDSGADISLLLLSVGRLVGLRRSKRDKLQRIFGVGRSSVTVIVKRVPMQLGSVEFTARISWSQVEDVPLLLGRMDIFKKFDVTFKERAGLTSFVSRNK